jgi:membrane associated rhomboid family serine protease
MNDQARSIGRALKMHGFLLGGILAVMWGLEIVDLYALGGALDAYGIHPRETDKVAGIAFAPFLHGNLAHLMSNTVPFLIFGWIIMLHQVRDFFFVGLLSALVGGAGTWLVGAPGSVHIGASGVVFGFFGFLLLRGWFRRSVGSILLSIGIFVMYGGILWGVLPSQPGVSWEGHLFGFAGGVLAARMLAGRDRRRMAREQATAAAQPAISV